MSDKKGIIEDVTTVYETAARRMLAMNIESLQQFFKIDSVSFAAVIGLTLGEMLAQADNGSEQRMQLKGNELEPLKQTMLLNFNVAYNRTRSEIEAPIEPKKEIP